MSECVVSDFTDELVECWLNYLAMEGEDGQRAVNL